MLPSIMAWNCLLMRARWPTKAISTLGLATPNLSNKTRRAPSDMKGVKNLRRAAIERVVAQTEAWQALHSKFR